MRKVIVLACFLCFAPALLSAQAKDYSEERLKELEDRISALEARIKALEGSQGAVSARQAPPQAEGHLTARPSAPDASTETARSIAQAAPESKGEKPAVSGRGTRPGDQSGQLPVYGGASAAAKVFNPDMGIIGNSIGADGRNLINPYPALSLQESEVSLQAVVDPYARADFFLAIGEEGIEVEEGYVTFPAVPGGFRVRAGRMRAAFGRTNTFHNHTLPWVDRPLVAFNLMGGSLREADVGIKDAGLSVSRVFAGPKDIVLEGTGEVFRGDSGTLFQSNRRSDVSTVGHLKAYRDITESTNLELGGSYARGHNDVGSRFITQLYGADATLRWRPLRRAIYHSFAARTELVWSRREELANTQRAFGLFASTEYQLARRWFVGGRYDWSERARSAAQHDSGGSLVLTFWTSEFNQIRAQLRQTHYAEGQTANELLFQFLFTLGAHGAHPF
jgi:hypothetical protein